MNEDIERTFVSKFTSISGRYRFLRILKSWKRRTLLHTILPHCAVLDDRYIIQVPNPKQNHDDISKSWLKLGAPERCYILSANLELDGKEMLLFHALNKVLREWHPGTILVCIPDKLRYFECEEYNDRWVRCDSQSSRKDARRLKTLWDECP